jgi:hypothetical protein
MNRFMAIALAAVIGAGAWFYQRTWDRQQERVESYQQIVDAHNGRFVPDRVTVNTHAIRDELPTAALPELNVLTAFYVTALIAITALLFPAFQYFVRHRSVPQSVVDALAELRKTAVDKILNSRVTNPQEFRAWEEEQSAWPQSVIDLLEEHFSKAEVLGFQSLGVIEPATFPHAFNNEHNYKLSKLAKRLSVLEDIIRRHTR